MKTKFYLLIPVLYLIVGLASAQVSFPASAVKDINTYNSFDMAGYGNSTDDPEGLVKAVFCYEGAISLKASQIQGDEQYVSYAWYLLDKTGNEPGQAVHIGNGNEGQLLNYKHLRSGYHRFRVYGYNRVDQAGCFEVTEIAIYVLPQREITEYQSITMELCENEVGAFQKYAVGEIVLDADMLNIKNNEDFNNDTFENTFEWFLVRGGEEILLQSGLSASYSLGSSSNDLPYAMGNMSPGNFQYGIRVYYSFEGEAICSAVSILMYNLIITPAPSKPIIKIEGAAKSRN